MNPLFRRRPQDRRLHAPKAPAPMAVVITALLAMLAAGPTWAQPQGSNRPDDGTDATPLEHVPNDGLSDLLSDRTWSEPAHGISVRVPARATVQTVLPQAALVRFEIPGEVNITLSMRVVKPEASLEDVKARAAAELMFYHPSSSQIPDPVEPRQRAGRPSEELFGLVSEGDRPAWAFGQIHIRIAPTLTLVVGLTCPVEVIEPARRLLEAVAQSITIAEPPLRYAAQQAMLDAGQRWWLSRDPEAVAGLINQNRWFRLRDGGVDVGFRRVRFQEATEDGRTGLAAIVLNRVEIGPELITSELRAFESVDRVFEIWTFERARHRSGREARTAPAAPTDPARRTSTVPDSARQPAAGRVGEIAQRVNETGVRDGRELSVTVREHITEQNGWTLPEQGYLSQVELMMLPFVLPAQTADLAFFTYSQASRTVAMSTVRVRPASGDVWVALLRLHPHESERAIYYRPGGEVVGIELAPGRHLVPATHDEVAAVWGQTDEPQ